MKKVLSIFLALVIISQVFCATAFANSTELQHIQIPCQYIIWFDVYEDIIDGYFIDGSEYVEPSVIEMLTGYTAFQNEGKIVFTPTTSSPTLIYTIDAANEKLMRTAIATETTWDVDCIQLGDGTYCVNLEETLLAMNVQIAFSSDEEFSLCTYLPYTVYDAWEEYKNKQFNLFSLTEFGDISSDKISNLGVLSALNSLYLDYNDHFVKDSVLSWWSSDVLNATEDNFKDTMLEILLCMSDEKDGTWGSNPDYKSIKQDTKVLRLAAKMLKLLDVETEEGNIVAVLNATTSFGTKVISLTDFANTISQYKAVQETQRDMLKELFIAFPNYSEPQNGALKYVKNAAMFLSQRLEDNGVGTFSAICDGVIDLFSDVLEGTISEVTPILTIVKAVSDTIKGVPGLSNLADINKHTNVACNSWALLELSTENYVSYRKCVEQYKFPTEDELYRLKLVMLFKIMASVTVRQNIIDAKLSDKSALKELAQKNTELKSLYALILSSKPIAAPKDNTPTINWEEYVRKYNDGQVSQVIDTINSTNHDSMVRLYTDFVESGSYQRFIPDYQNSYESVYGDPNKYAILDINGDGIEELIIAGETASEFTNFMVFSYDKGHDEIYSLSLHSVASGKEDEGFSLCYGSLRFSSRFHALVFSETRPEYFGGVDFFVVKGRDIVPVFSLWFEEDFKTQQVTYQHVTYFVTESGTTDILSKDEYLSEDEYFSYMVESSELEWNPISHDSSNQPGDGWGDWGDYVDEDTVVIYPVEGGNLYFGQMSLAYYGDGEDALEWFNKNKTKIELLCADSTITSAHIPETINGLTVNSTAGAAFFNCAYLESVYFPATINYVFGEDFRGCINLKEIYIPEGNPSCYTVDGILYRNFYNGWTNTEEVSLELFPAAREDEQFTIPDWVTDIDHWAFGDAANLRIISIPDSVKHIQASAFGYRDSNVHFTDIYYEGSEEQWDAITSHREFDTLINTTIHYNSTSPDSPESSQAGWKNDSRTAEANFREAIENIQRRIEYDVLSERQKECCRGELFKIDGQEALVLMYYTPGSSDMAPGYYAGLWVANSNGTVSCLTDYRIEAISNSDDAYVTVIIREINGKMYFNPYVRKIIDGKDISKNQYYYIGDTLVLEYDLQSEESIDYIGDGTIQPNDSNSVYFFNQEKTDRSTFYSTKDRLDIGTYILGLDPNWTEGAPPQGYTFEELLAQLPEGTTPDNSNAITG